MREYIHIVMSLVMVI